MPDQAVDSSGDLRPLRLRAMLTQEELARKSGVGVRTIRYIEAGKVHPQPRTLRLIIEALGEAGRGYAGAPRGPRTEIPRELPRALAEFAGREQQLRELVAAVDCGAAVIAVHGMAGVGKTSLAVHAAHELASRYPDGQVFVDLLGFSGDETDRPSPDSVLVRVLRSCNVDIKDMPVEVGELAAVYRSTLAERRVLLVFDNAANAEEVERLLPGTSDSLVITTSRRDLSVLPATHSVPLEPPPMREAVAMIAAATSGRTTADETEAIAERCGRLPLAMGLAAARLRSRPWWKAADLLQRLDDENQLLDELDLGHRGVAAAFGASYRELDAPQRRLLRRLSLVPGDDVDAYAAAALCDIEPEQASAILESLVDVHLVETCSPGRYRRHDLVRIFAARLARAEESDDERDAAFQRLIDVYLHFAYQAAIQLQSQFRRVYLEQAPAHDLGLPGFDGEHSAVSWFEAEHGNLASAVHAANRAGHLEPAWHLASVFTAFRMHGRDTEQHLAINRTALDIACELGDESRAAHSLADQGRLLMFAGRNREAIDCLDEVAAIKRRLGDNGGTALALRSIGIQHKQSGRFTEALDVYRSALELAETSSRAGVMANIAANMVDALLALGRLPEAERLLKEAEQHLEADDDYLPLRFEVARGTFARTHGDPGAALATHTACLERCREAGLQGGYTLTLIEIGFDLIHLDRTAEAVARLHQAAEHAEGMAYLTFERCARNALGRALAASGDFEAAIEQHERVLGLAESQEDAYQLAKAHHGLADAYLRNGETSAVKRHLRSAAEGYVQCGVPEASVVIDELAAMGPEVDHGREP